MIQLGAKFVILRGSLLSKAARRKVWRPFIPPKHSPSFMALVKRIAAYESPSRRSALANVLQTMSDEPRAFAFAFSGCRAATLPGWHGRSSHKPQKGKDNRRTTKV